MSHQSSITIKVNPYIFGAGGGGFNDDDLKSYWKFDDAVTPVKNDSQSAADLGDAADLDMTGATYLAGEGIIDNTWSFDGVDDKGIAGSSVSQYNFLHQGTPKFTIIIWFKHNTGTWGTDQTTFFNTMINTAEAGILIFNHGTKQIRMQIGAAPPNGAILTFDTGVNFLSDDTDWHMLSLTYDHSLGSNNAKAKLDDADLRQGTKTATSPSSADAGNAGHVGLRDNASMPLNCKLDEFSIWNRVLTDAEITELYNSGAALAIY